MDTPCVGGRNGYLFLSMLFELCHDLGSLQEDEQSASEERNQAEVKREDSKMGGEERGRKDISVGIFTSS